MHTSLRQFAIAICILLVPASMHAHAMGENYIYLNIRADSMDGSFEIHENALEKALGIQLEKETASETVAATAGQVQAYIVENFAIGAGGVTYPITFTGTEVIDINLGKLAKYDFIIGSGPVPDLLDIRHTMLYEVERFHRGILMVVENAKTGLDYGEETTAMVFGPSTSEQQLDLIDVPKALGAKSMIPQGVLHIWIGLDHILFLLCLLLPAVLVREDNRMVPSPTFAKVFWRVFKIVTLFTIAHSITLGLAALDFISLSSQLVESIIALSIVLVALNNLFLKTHSANSVVIVVLGLFHGMGFASVMGELPFRMQDALKCVIGFNIGVELGQMALVAIFFPVLYLLRKQKLYYPVVLCAGSITLALVAGYWFVQRAFGLG